MVKANNSKWGSITYFYNDIMISSVNFWKFESKQFSLFNLIFFLVGFFCYSSSDHSGNTFLTNNSSWQCWPQQREKQSQNASRFFPFWLLWRHPASHREHVKSCLWTPCSKELFATPILKETRQDSFLELISDLDFYTYFSVNIIRFNIYIMAQHVYIFFLIQMLTC